MATLLKKLSPKTLCGKIKAPEVAHPLYVIYGNASGTKQGTSDYGTWLALTGRFEAVVSETGELFVGPQAFLPEPMNSLVADAIMQEDGDGKRVNNAVQFAIEVGIKPSDVPIGYEYTCKEIIDKAEADPLAALRNEVKAALPAPAAPSEESEEKPAAKAKGKK